MDARRDPQEWLELRGQRQRLVDLAKRQLFLDHARYYAALVALSRDDNFTIVLEHMFMNLCLVPEKVPGSEKNLGKQELYWELLKDLRMAQEHSAVLAAQANQL